MRLILGDCLQKLSNLPTSTIDCVVTDPPYGLNFMGKKWDYDVPSVDVWREVLRVLKPGGHLLSFGGTRTYHRMVVAIEDAGFEVRDQVMWIYGSGFPKSADVSKHIDRQERDKWSDIANAIDNLNYSDILNAWSESLKTAKSAARKSAKSTTETGMSTLSSAFAQSDALAFPVSESAPLNAIIAEVSLSERLRISEAPCIALASAELTQTPSLSLAISAESPHASLSATRTTRIFTVGSDAKGLLSENLEQTTRAVEVLTTWLGKQKSSKLADISALCAGLTDAWKLTILSQSKTFQNSDTQSKMDCASATTATITRSTAESLISFTAGILKLKAIDKAAGAEREVIGLNANHRKGESLGKDPGVAMLGQPHTGTGSITAPATDSAKQWQGYGTALKPANEPIVLARKPLEKGLTVAANVLKWGTGALNIDGTRIGYASEQDRKSAVPGDGKGASSIYSSETDGSVPWKQNTQGRWPANVLFDEQAALALDEMSIAGGIHSAGKARAKKENFDQSKSMFGIGHAAGSSPRFEDSTIGASRFFYCAKSSKSERNAGLEGMPERECTAKQQNSSGRMENGVLTNERPSEPRSANHHPTVKPIKLMEYLITLVCPPGGIVLDPFMGSGSTGVAAMRLSREFIGIERELEYLEIARRRIESVVKPQAEDSQAEMPV